LPQCVEMTILRALMASPDEKKAWDLLFKNRIIPGRQIGEGKTRKVYEATIRKDDFSKGLVAKLNNQ